MNDFDSGSINLENSEEFRKFLEASLTDNSTQYLFNSVQKGNQHLDISTSCKLSPSFVTQLNSSSPSIQLDESEHEDNVTQFKGNDIVANLNHPSFSRTISQSSQEMHASSSAYSILWKVDSPPPTVPFVESPKDGIHFTLSSQTLHSYRGKLSIASAEDFTDTFSELENEDVGERSLGLSHSHFRLGILKEIESGKSQEESSESGNFERPSNNQVRHNSITRSIDGDNELCLSHDTLYGTKELEGEELSYSQDFENLPEDSLIEQDESSSPSLNMLGSWEGKGDKFKHLDTVFEISEGSKEWEENSREYSNHPDLEYKGFQPEQPPSDLDADVDNSFRNTATVPSPVESNSQKDLSKLQKNEQGFPDIPNTRVLSLSDKLHDLAKKEVKSATRLIIKKNKKSRIPLLSKPSPPNAPLRASTNTDRDNPHPSSLIKKPLRRVNEVDTGERDDLINEVNVVSQVDARLELDNLRMRNSELGETICSERRKATRLTSDLEVLNANFNDKERELNENKHEIKMLQEDVERLQTKLFSANARIERLTSLDLERDSERLSEERLQTQKTVKDQDELIQSYQKENEKIYVELSKIKGDKKSIETRFLKETQLLKNQIDNLKSQLGLPTEDKVKDARDPISAERYEEVSYFEKIIEKILNEKIELEKQQKGSIQLISEQKTEIIDLRRMLRDKSDDNAQSQRDTIEMMKSKYENEAIDLNKKLKWYSDNYKIMEKDLAKVCKLQEKNNELERKLTLTRSPDNIHSGMNRPQIIRIQELENEILMLKELLPKTQSQSNPSHIPAFELDDGLVCTDIDNQNEFEKCKDMEIERLKKELFEKEKDYEMKLNSFEIKLQDLEDGYEEKLKSQQCKLSALQREQQRKSHPHATVQSLLRELESVRQCSALREQELNVQVDQLAQDNRQLKALIGTYKQRPISDGKKSVPKDNDDLQSYCNSLEMEISWMTTKLKKMETEQGTNENNTEYKYTSTQIEFANEKLNREIERLKSEISLANLQLESEKSKHLEELTSTREDHRMQLERELRKHQQNLTALKAYHAVQYSDSQGAQLSSENSSLKLKISWLENRLQESRTKLNQNELLIASENQLKQKIQLLSDELVEAKQQQLPEIRHFASLKQTIIKLEKRLKEQEKIIRSSADRNQKFNQGEASKREDELKLILVQKDVEIDNFKRELDILLSLMKQLQKQNLVDLSTPLHSHNHINHL